MLVKYHMGFIMVGETTEIQKKFFRKPVEIRHTIYLSTGVSGICDENDVLTEVNKSINKQFQSKGWGKDFSGWQRYLTQDEFKQLSKLNKDWYTDINPDKLNIITSEYIYNWKMEKIIKELTFNQFSQLCKENQLNDLLMVKEE